MILWFWSRKIFTVVRSNGSKAKELWSKKFLIFWSNIPGSKEKMILWFWSWNFFDLVILILIFIWSKVQNCLIFDLKIQKKFDPMICNKILAWSFDLNLLSILISWSVFLEFFDPMICIFRIFDLVICIFKGLISDLMICGFQKVVIYISVFFLRKIAL